MQCLDWLMSDEVPSFLEDLVINLFANSLSLSVERKHNLVKQWLGRKLSHLSSVSCNFLCGEYHRWHLEQSRLFDEASQELRLACATGEF